MRPRSRPGLTLMEVIALTVVGTLVLVILVIADSRPRVDTARAIRSAGHLRGMHQGLITFAADNKGDYPIPSLLDRANTTEPTAAPTGFEKNRTGAVFSILLAQAILSPEVLVDPAEANPNIRAVAETEFESTAPSAAVDPELALWDPRFKGTPDPFDRSVKFDPDNRIPDHNGMVSYAHLPLRGARLNWWNVDANLSRIPVLANRGPKFAGDDGAMPTGGWQLVDGAEGGTSYTLAIHGPKQSWEGNVGYNDGSVRYEQSPAPKDLVIECHPGGVSADNLFCAEPSLVMNCFAFKPTDDSDRQNAYLRLFRVGPDPTIADQTRTITGGDPPWWDGLE